MASASFTIAAHRGASAAMKAANSSGVPTLVIELKRAMAVSVSGLSSPAFTAPLSFSMICGGVPAGATTPVQASMVKSG